jgi:hypothetical protein
MLGKINFKVLSNDENDDNETFYCSICNYTLVTSKDHKTNSEFNCCNDCYLTFIEGYRHTVEKVKRPKQELIDNYLLQKKIAIQKLGEDSEF